jgi:ribosome-associated protein
MGGFVAPACAERQRSAVESGGRRAVGYDNKRVLATLTPASAMTRPDPAWQRRRAANDDAPSAADDAPPRSKTQRKADMHALQSLGEALVALDPRRFGELAADAAFPEQLADAIAEARTITAWGARRRQLQFVGRLMRGIDPEPVRRRLAAWEHGHDRDAARQHALERLRERLLAEPAALAELAAAHPTLDQTRLAALIARARAERVSGAPPRAFRELFRVLKSLAG